jgi:S-adenosylmethionine/arginine decarboxylase-like enzyme
MDTGRHVIIDAWTQESKLINDPQLVGSMLNELVELVGMQILRPAEIVAVPLDPSVASGADDGGVTGTVLLTTSHASIHTWPLRGHVSFDLFSCKDFNVKQVIDFLWKKFGLTGGSIRNVRRQHEPKNQHSWDIISNDSFD